LLTTTPAGTTAYVEADAQDTARIVEAASRTLDFSQPIAAMVLFVLHYVPDSASPHEIVSRLMEAMPAGSYLTMSNVTSDIDTDRAVDSVRRFNAQPVAARMTLRTREQISEFFDGLDFVEPAWTSSSRPGLRRAGLVPLPQWRPQASPARVIAAYGGMARKS
jgi:S-adenosyl methyltransferase